MSIRTAKPSTRKDERCPKKSRRGPRIRTTSLACSGLAHVPKRSRVTAGQRPRDLESRSSGRVPLRRRARHLAKLVRFILVWVAGGSRPGQVLAPVAPVHDIPFCGEPEACVWIHAEGSVPI